MKKDITKTDVLFLVNEEISGDNDIFAFFPTEKYSDDIDDLYTCYQHVGQHSACHIDYANASRPATAEERKALLSELESLGYNLNILN